MAITIINHGRKRSRNKSGQKAVPGKPEMRIRNFKLKLRAKLILPYLFLALAVAIAATYLVTRIVLSSWTERFNNQLVTAADEAADTIVRYEQSQLATWRQIAFTEGVAEAAAAQDGERLASLIRPLLLNSDASRLDIVTQEGTAVFQLAEDDNAAIPNYADWELIKHIQADSVNRFAGLQAVNEDVIFYTGGALTAADGTTNGVLLVGTPLHSLATILSESILAGVTFYGPDGRLLTSTIGQADTAALALPAALAEQALAEKGQQINIRTIAPAQNEYAQILTPFELGQGYDVGILGVSLRLNLLASPLYPTRQVITTVFTAAVIATLLIGYALAAGIVRPVEQLMDASNQVAAGNLDVQVTPKSGDEIGQLAESFNDMVKQLRQRREVETLFGRFVGENIARRILAGEADLGGQRVWATVLFSDIRDFTAFTEKADLTMLIEELNEYYAGMQRVIEAHGGVINKFGGDSILALFGTPLPLENHAQQAVLAAVDMMKQLAGLNARRLARGDVAFRIGIGVNTGEMIAGNLGSEQRREFTVLGDTVNAAKRLSDLNKDSPLHSIFISGATRRELSDPYVWQMDDLGQIQVKGKEEPVTVYALMQAVNSALVEHA